MTDDTLRDVRGAHLGPPSRWARRIGTCALLIIVIAGAFGIFGVHSRTATTANHGWTLSVTYPQTARAGLDVPWRARVHHDGGLPDKLTIAVSTDYFRMFETQGFFPDADSATNDGRFVYLTFTMPDGDDFDVDYDAYIQPGSQLGKSATVEVIDSGAIVAHTAIRTWLVP